MAFSSSILGPIAANLLSGFGQEQASLPQIVGLDLSLLAFRPPPDPASLDNRPAVIPPWQLASVQEEAESPLEGRVNEIRRLRSFIDETAPGVDAVGVGGDERATFVLFDALSRLETLAEFAAQRSTPEAQLASLDTLFRRGLAEIGEHVAGLELDRLTLLAGTRASSIESPVTLGFDTRSLTGAAVATDGRDDPVPGVVGDEVFTLSLTRNGETSDILVDLSAITDSLSIDAIVDHVNALIKEIPALDENGDPILDSNGDPVPRFATRFAVVSDSDGDHAIRINTGFFESARLTPGGPDMSLYVGSNMGALLGDEGSARLTRFDGIATDISQALRTDIAAIDRDATAIASAGGEETTVAAPTSVSAVAVDSRGFVYTVGTTSGDLGSEFNQAGEGEDVFLTKLDSRGNVLFSRLLGGTGDSQAFSLAIDSNDNVVVVGQTTDNLAPGALLSGRDGFLAKFSATGDELFTVQLDTASTSEFAAVAFDAQDNIVIAGTTSGAVDAATPGQGGRDTLALRFDGTSGARLDAAVIGSSDSEQGRAVARAADGNILLASTENGRAVLRKLDAADLSNVLFEIDLGTIGLSGDIGGIAVEGDRVFISGSTDNTAFDGGGAASIGNAHAGDRDGFVLALTDSGASASVDRLTFVGTAAADTAGDIVVSGDDVFLSGTTRGDLSGTGRVGPRDAFVLRMDALSGLIEEVEQFGQLLNETTAGGLALAENGPSVLDRLGLPAGDVGRTETRDIISQTTARAGDFFEISIDGGRPRRVEIREGDTLADLATRIERLTLVRDVGASIADGKLTIRALGEHRVSLIAGDGSRDLLAKLGLKETELFGTGLLFGNGEEPDEEDLGGIFGLGLDEPLGLGDRQAAEFTLTRIRDAIETVKRAFRSLRPNPLDDLLQPSGSVPTRLTNQIANYSAALARLQAGGLNGTGGFLI